jgi:hypothetical protein
MSRWISLWFFLLRYIVGICRYVWAFQVSCLVRNNPLYFIYPIYILIAQVFSLLINRLLLASKVIPKSPVDTSTLARKTFLVQSLPKLGIILRETLRIQKLVTQFILQCQQRPERQVHGSVACWREGFSWRRIDRSGVVRQNSDSTASWALTHGYSDSAAVGLLAISAADG